MYQTEFTELHPMRKVVISVYCEDKTQMWAVDNYSYGYDRFRE